MTRRQISGVARWLRFNLVGLIGVGIQLGVLWLLVDWGMPHVAAVVLAVEAAVVHNFAWHERYTWNDRAVRDLRTRWGRLLKLNLSNGLVSLGGSVLITDLLVREKSVPILGANAVAILVCSTVNFLLGDRFVFRSGGGPKGGTTLFCGG